MRVMGIDVGPDLSIPSLNTVHSSPYPQLSFQLLSVHLLSPCLPIEPFEKSES
jgi:hypothetical protein